jgi:hypothetical protein
MTESGIATNAVELPCDCGDPAHECSGSRYLCPVCNPRRSLIAAVRDVSAVRDMPVWTFDLLRPARDNVVSLAARRVKRAAR